MSFQIRVINPDGFADPWRTYQPGEMLRGPSGRVRTFRSRAGAHAAQCELYDGRRPHQALKIAALEND